MSKVGHVHSIETFGNVDGPGIRFILFLQGCTLRCKYCHNRDSWKINAGKEMTVDDILTEVLKYREFFDASGGGITVSGGEPLIQLPFLIELFKACKKEEIHTTIDTSGGIRLTNRTEPLLDALLTYTDLVLLDIKLMDPAGHKSLIGVPNDHILAMGRFIADAGTPLWIRRVIVPGLTDDEADLKETADYIKELNQRGTVEKIEVLPYHPMGEHKWAELGLEYPLKGQRAPTSEEMEKAETILKAGLE
ncbi:MAG: pyruvate formate-lyase-activating protein [Defluviitaleaceae bacterium]|nr:pyruvate formate-lyase-activating protein [Defluviitaleaceae bacterium]